MEQPDGHILLVDKPYRWTSFDVVGKLRNKLKIKKIGHAGTLDPLATGLLILCTGKKTRQIEQFMGLEKEYTGIFRLGATTASHDLETEVIPSGVTPLPGLQELLPVVQQFIGALGQVPPAHSAIRVGGRRAYQFARQGKEIDLTLRQVYVRQFEITAYHSPDLHFRIVCSKGTYIRSLARDVGNALGCGAYLHKLCRTRIGPYDLKQAQQIDSLVISETPVV